MIRIFALTILLLSATGAWAQPILGSWEWRETHLESGEIIDPETEHYTRQLLFIDVVDDFNFIEYADGELFAAGYWTTSDIIVDGETLPYLFIDVGACCGWIEGVLRFADGDETMIIENFNTMYFDRLPPSESENATWGGVRRLFR